MTAAVATAQDRTVTLDMRQVISIANDSSLMAFRYKNLYLSSYWEFRNYKANRLPSLGLSIEPVNYSRNLTKRYDYVKNIDVYREQKSYSASTGLTLSQNFDPIGGTFFVETNTQYLRNFGDSTYNQFTTIPIRIGYRNELFGYNGFKWDRRIEPLKYERAKLEYLYNSESVAATAVSYFFALATAQTQYDMAVEQSAACDSLLVIGERRYKIGSIKKNDLLSLRLDAVNARNSITTAEIARKRASLNLASFLGMPTDTDIKILLPGSPSLPVVDVDKALEMMHQNSYMIKEKMQAVAESEKELDRTNKTTRFNASVNASVGFNQAADNFADSYRDPMRQDIASLSLSIPLVDWKQGRGQRNIAKNNLSIANIDAQQKIIELEQDVIITTAELSSRHQLLASAEQALILANDMYKETRSLFQMGNGTVADLTNAQQKLLNAQNSYIQSMQNYWACYYELRKLTLYDFELGFSLSDKFDYDNLVK
jgi:Outer membrane protein